MNFEEIRDYCLAKKGAHESFPFDSETLVFKVGGKMFLLTGLENTDLRFNVKCDPELAIELRERYSSVLPGYHMSKKHWNTIICSNDLSDDFLKEQIDNSYNLVFASLPKKVQKELID